MMRLGPWVAVLLMASGCAGSQAGGAPQPSAVEPDRGYPTGPIHVVIRGDGFEARARQPSGGGAPSLETIHRAWLDEVELEGVTWRDVHTLDATVPPGLALGPHRLTVEDALGRRGTLDAAYTVLAAPSFSATAALDRGTVNPGQGFNLTVTVANSGGADVVDLTAAVPTFSSVDGGAAAVTGPPPAALASLAPGQSHAFSWACVASAAGRLTAAVVISAVDGLTAAPLTATPLEAPQLEVQRPASLVVAAAGGLALPAAVPVGADFDVVMTVDNSGGAAAREVAPGALSIVAGSTGGATYKSGPRPASATVPGGGSATFTWTFTAGRTAGSLQLSGGAAGLDANTSAVVQAAPAASNAAALLAPHFLVTVAVTNAGGTAGGVTSSPAGIACLAGDVCAASFEAGQGVTLSATTAAVSWTGCDSALGAVCTLQALAGPRTVVAAF